MSNIKITNTEIVHFAGHIVTEVINRISKLIELQEENNHNFSKIKHSRWREKICKQNLKLLSELSSVLSDSNRQLNHLVISKQSLTRQTTITVGSLVRPGWQKDGIQSVDRNSKIDPCQETKRSFR